MSALLEYISPYFLLVIFFFLVCSSCCVLPVSCAEVMMRVAFTRRVFHGPWCMRMHKYTAYMQNTNMWHVGGVIPPRCGPAP